LKGYDFSRAGTDDFYQGALAPEANMAREILWTDSEEIGIQLQEKFPELDPLTVRFTDLHKFVIELDGFADDPLKSNESKLEAIQMAWHEEYKDAQG
jgi:FeS assembly protein IscX